MPEFEWVSFTTDYGLDDGFVGACHGVIARIAPRVRVLDVTHGVPAQDVRAGAAMLAQAVPYLPSAVHLAVVDPGVGTSRRGLVVLVDKGLLVGPDNGVLLPAAEALGGPLGAVELADPRWWLPEVSRTFHGRDVFAPVTAWLARGLDPAKLGPEIPLPDLTPPPPAMSTVEGDRVGAEVVMVDRFGNLQLAVRGDAAPWREGSALRVRARGVQAQALWVTTFGDAPDQELIVLTDSAGRLALAVTGGSAAERLALTCGDVVELEPAG